MGSSRNTRDKSSASLSGEDIMRGIEFDIREMEGAREYVGMWKTQGYVGPNGEVTVITGPLSSVTYRLGGVTFSGI